MNTFDRKYSSFDSGIFEMQLGIFFVKLRKSFRNIFMTIYRGFLRTSLMKLNNNYRGI